MQVQVNTNKLVAKSRDYINENEYNIHEIDFDFAEEYTFNLVKVALFTRGNQTYKMTIANNKCNIPPEILAKKGTFILGVYAYEVNNNELVLRYSPSPIQLFVSSGSYIPDEQTENSEPITPSEMEQYQQALQEGLTEVNNKLAEIDNLDIDAVKVEDTTTITITDKQGNEKSVEILDGKDGIVGRDGVSPIITETKTQNGYDITITDITGTNTISLTDGDDGKDGTNGLDGFSPILTETQTQNGYNITITDANGTRTIALLNGEDGAKGDKRR